MKRTVTALTLRKIINFQLLTRIKLEKQKNNNNCINLCQIEITIVYC